MIVDIKRCSNNDHEANHTQYDVKISQGDVCVKRVLGFISDGVVNVRVVILQL